MLKLSFQNGNAKLTAGGITTFSLPSGHTCPGARLCLSKADQHKGTITDGPETEYRCFSASQEAAFSNVRSSRWNNFTALRRARTADDFATILEAALPPARLTRIHVAGDFFNQAYFDGWLQVARRHPETIFYAYTKSLAFWASCMDAIPPNFRLVASRGGRMDFLIEAHQLPSATVVSHPDEARKLGLPIDHTDEYAWGENRQDFALLLHGTQPKGSTAAQALQQMKLEKVQFSYPRKSGRKLEHTQAAPVMYGVKQA